MSKNHLNRIEKSSPGILGRLKNRVFLWLWRGLLLVFVLALGMQAWFFAHIFYWRGNNPSSTRFMRLAQAELQAKNPQARLAHIWVPYEKISIQLKRAVIAAEDSHFLEHDGFDWDGIQFALEKNLSRGQTRAGGSTITQQLAKNLFLSPSRSYLRKGQEAAIAMMIEMLWSKRRTLEVYLNVAQWGDGIFGAEAAALHYYRIPAAQLGPAESARLAVMLPNPRRYGRVFGPMQQARAQRIRFYMDSAQVP
ncbi:MAG: monofunctional biosynthetic peptidoglycan transglycosylase [Azoarcus sp.]|jgi:monofunctional biosynthetic peptidoglycan transglycosylase|nr:monofunctional biosynthetic peptidoglycan transglycosylase [Azoarcus sp.]